MRPLMHRGGFGSAAILSAKAASAVSVKNITLSSGTLASWFGIVSWNSNKLRISCPIDEVICCLLSGVSASRNPMKSLMPVPVVTKTLSLEPSITKSPQGILIQSSPPP